MRTHPSSDFSTHSFEHPLVAADIVVFGIHDGQLSVVLVRRARAPFEGRWAIPGGFVLSDETIDAAALRELREETGIRVPGAYLEQLYTFGGVRRDPRGRVISVTYVALVHGEDIVPRGGSDAADAQWWPMAHLLPSVPTSPRLRWASKTSGSRPLLAFDHAEILAYAIQRLRYKLEYTNVCYAMLPPRFALSELQTTYEVILGKELDKRNFRKKIVGLGFVKPTQEWRTAKQGRPAQLWRFTKREPVLVKTFVAK